MIELKHVSKIYETKKVKKEALQNINLKINGIGMLFLLGKSGSGKSTLLNLLGALDSATDGSILVGGLDLTKCQEKELDCYRNGSVGFVFQDFNLLENFNVYENIEFALKLQEKNISKEEIDKKLKEFDLEGLGNRKINELSGGQKQRVAMIRAIIKNPSIVLADEPTGNLDVVSSKKVFDILKKISQDRLVIIVSHDRETAFHYADRIIELEDGKIIMDSGTLKEKEVSFKKKTPFLPFEYTFKTALINMFSKKTKLVLTILLMSISLIFATFALNCNFFSQSLLIENTMSSNHNYRFTIEHISRIQNLYGGYTSNYKMSEEKLKELQNLSNSILNPSYHLYHYGTYLSFQFNEKKEDDVFFPQIPYITDYVELKDENYLEFLDGTLPKGKQEIVVHEYLAKYIIKYGVYDNNGEIYKPNNIKELLNEKHLLKLGENEVRITGVVKDDTSHYLESFEKNKFQTKELEKFYQENYIFKSHTVYVSDFVNQIILNNPKEQVLEKSYLQIGNNFETNFVPLKEDIKIYNENGVERISKLQENEVILSIDSLSKIDNTFQTSFINFLKEHNIEEDAFESFINNYFKTNPLKNISTVFRTLKNNDEWLLYTPQIIGITIEPNNYVSNDYIENYEPYTRELSSVKVYEKERRERIKLLSHLKLKELTMYDEDFELDYDLLKTDYLSGTTEIMNYYKFLKKYIFIITCIFMLFTCLLFLNFLYTTIIYSKKEIGILRSLGANKKCTTKIFLLEAILVGVVAYVISMLGFLCVISYINNQFTKRFFYHLNVIVFHPFIPITIFVFTLLLSCFITIFSIDKIGKIKPIDAILNK